MLRTFFLLATLSAATAAVAAPAALSACIASEASFDGSVPLRYAVVGSDAGSKLYLYSRLSAACLRGANNSCTRGGYLVPGEIVAVGKTCDGWDYVQYIGASRITYGWLAAERLTEWHSSHEEVESAIRAQVAESPIRFQFSFRLVEGRGTPVCEAYVQRLNRTPFTRPAYCGRPENDSVPGFEWLHRVPISTSEVNRLSGTDLPPTAKVVSWRYDPAIDADNDGQPDSVLMWNLDDADDPRCGMAYYAINPTLDTGFQMALILTADGASIDLAETQKIFGATGGDSVEPSVTQYSRAKPFLKGFRGYGNSYGLFRFHGTTYFDTFLNGKPNRQPPLGKGLSSLRVYLRQRNVTRVMCTIRSSDK